MTEEQTPALSKEEWTSGRHGEPGLIRRGSWNAGSLNVEFERTRDLFMGHTASGLGIRCGGKGGPMAMLEREDAHALAALCLYQQPFGFTQEDVKALELWTRSASFGGAGEWEKRIASLASRIANLLPPEGPE